VIAGENAVCDAFLSAALSWFPGTLIMAATALAHRYVRSCC
jgi:hypothetical protein